jgi:hypothetical protein
MLQARRLRYASDMLLGLALKVAQSHQNDTNETATKRNSWRPKVSGLADRPMPD